jgi:hypothetical protein
VHAAGQVAGHCCMPAVSFGDCDRRPVGGALPQDGQVCHAMWMIDRWGTLWRISSLHSCVAAMQAGECAVLRRPAYHGQRARARFPRPRSRGTGPQAVPGECNRSPCGMGHGWASMRCGGVAQQDVLRRRIPSPQKSGIGAQFGGKYFAHDVRVIRLPRHGASCPVCAAGPALPALCEMR